jgi:hypothetical protein
MAGAAGGECVSLKVKINRILLYNEEYPGNLERITTRDEYYALTGGFDFYDQKVYVRDAERRILFVFIACGLKYEIEDVLYYRPSEAHRDGRAVYIPESEAETEWPESESEDVSIPEDVSRTFDNQQQEAGYIRSVREERARQRERERAMEEAQMSPDLFSSEFHIV